MSYAIANQEYTEVSFYRVINKISADDVRKNNISGVVLDKSPIFTTKDIIVYSQSEHTIKLTKEAYKKICALSGEYYFAICVDNKPVYLGLVLPQYSSTRFAGLTIETTNDECNEIQLRIGIDLYPDGLSSIVIVGDIPESIKDSIDDPRQNKLVLDSLRKSNKLVETISEQKALEIAKKFFLELNYGPIEQYKFTAKSGCKSWSIYYSSTGKYNYITNYGAIIVNKKTGETKNIPGIEL